MKTRKLMGVGIVATLAALACAAVTFDPSTGTGFVGKGDVQLAFGWSNSQLQKNASGVTFTYETLDSYQVTCYIAGNVGGDTIYIYRDVSSSASVDATVAFDPRVKNQITGFKLTGYDSYVTDGTVPIVGGWCPSPDYDGYSVSAVTPLGSSGGLYANYGTSSVLLH